MEFYTRFVANFLFPLQEKLKDHDTVAIRKQMEDSQWWPKDKLAQYQLAKLQKLLARAEQSVPYYQQCFREMDFLPAQVGSLADLQKLPFLTKPIIRSQGERMKANDAHGLARFNTGGSSGEPLIFFIGTERVSHDVAAKWRATRWWNVDIGDREIVVWAHRLNLAHRIGYVPFVTN